MKKLYQWLLGVFFPPKCVLCRKLLKEEETDLCPFCRISAPYFSKRKSKPQFLDSFTAVWYYEDSVRSSLLRFKFGGVRAYGAPYARQIAEKLRKEQTEYDILVWIPVSWLRKLRRGYDQVERIANPLSRELNLELVCALKKIRHTRPQSRIRGVEKRKANVLGAYRVVLPEKVKDKRILLLDDIVTTGVTMAEAARVLKTAGAKEVHGISVASKK